MIKKFITSLDSSKASGNDCIPVVVLRKSKPELLYILAELFKMYLKESCFPDCWEVSRSMAGRSMAENYHPVSLLSVISRVFDKLINNRLVDY